MRRYLGLILTIASLPLLAEAAHATCPVYNLANNTTADATQVMANFNCILSGPSFSGPITFQGISAPAVSASGQGTIYFDAASHSFKVSENGGTYAALVNTGGGGSSQWTTSGSNVYFSSGNVGIGTTNPANTLSVVGQSGTNIFTVSDGARTASVYINSNAVWIGGLTSSVPTVFSANNNGNVAAFPSGGTVFGLYSWADPGANNVSVPKGSVAIGKTSPAYALDVNGTVYATGAAGALSDARDKKNVQPLAFNALDVITKLRPVTFYWKAPRDNGMTGRQTGLIAQEVENVLPSTILIAKDARKSKAIKYDELTAVLIKAVQEQQGHIKQQDETLARQQALIARLQQQNAKLEARLGWLETKRVARAN